MPEILKKYPHITTEIAPIEEISPQDYLDFFKQWAKIKELDTDELNEYSAFERFIRNKETGGHIVTMHDGATIVAFATYELLGCDYAVCHFGKANKHYAGIYDGLYFAVSKALQSVNVRYWNLEQDLGIPSLRLSKTKYKPEFYLKKYIVEIKKPT